MSEMEGANKSKGDRFQALCINCKCETEHFAVQSFDKAGEEFYDDNEPPAFQWSESYQIIRCAGCKTVTFRKASWHSDEEAESIELYPMRQASMVPVKDYYAAPPVLRRIYRETISAFNSESFTLCAAGLRAVVEGICVSKGVTEGPYMREVNGQTVIKRSGNLEGKIGGLVEIGVITKTGADALQHHRFIGNDALHELLVPSADELAMSIQIIEHVLDELFEVPDVRDELKNRHEMRKAGKKVTPLREATWRAFAKLRAKRAFGENQE